MVYCLCCWNNDCFVSNWLLASSFGFLSRIIAGEGKRLFFCWSSYRVAQQTDHLKKLKVHWRHILKSDNNIILLQFYELSTSHSFRSASHV